MFSTGGSTFSVPATAVFAATAGAGVAPAGGRATLASSGSGVAVLAFLTAVRRSGRSTSGGSSAGCDAAFALPRPDAASGALALTFFRTRGLSRTRNALSRRRPAATDSSRLLRSISASPNTRPETAITPVPSAPNWPSTAPAIVDPRKPPAVSDSPRKATSPTVRAASVGAATRATTIPAPCRTEGTSARARTSR